MVRHPRAFRKWVAPAAASLVAVAVFVVGIVLFWTLTSPWTESAVTSQKLQGSWSYESSSGHAMNLRVHADSRVELTGWPSSLGCTGPSAITGQTRKRCRLGTSALISRQVDFRGQC